ncbi:MAG TPA: ComEC/Rec2 family competence protein [Chitinophagaceae bacterium]|nr:ComEC/Rec2 family competence protein [Chitinophagaceae bacterium]
MTFKRSYFWKKAPFVKILCAFIPGIVVQFYFDVPEQTGWLLFSISLFISCIFSFLPFFNRYKYSFLQGIFLSAIFFCAGMILTRQKDIRNDKRWFGNLYKEGNTHIIILEEPPVEKTRSFKASARTRFIGNTQLAPVKGNIIVYFRKDTTGDKGDRLPLGYGTRILFKKTLQEIRNAGNPGGFDYQRYCLFQGITHQVFLNNSDYLILAAQKESGLKKLIFTSRERILNILRNYINEKELGLAEALLIGYKEDLEQSLVQSYTNTGVVHIIAISGLHLGLIYWLLVLLFKPFGRYVKLKWMRTLLIIAGLWAFSLLAGAQPSILRSAFMFSFIALGENFNRKTSIYNSIAVSAFLLLCIKPFWLWDVGFQLSYSAVLSIIIFMRPIYNWFYFSNKILDFFWKLNAVTLAAQILTLPISIYYFHQFPTFFFLTNFIAVPLSSLILLGEIALCAFGAFPLIAQPLGKMISWLIWFMNSYIERVEDIRFSLWEGLQINTWQVLMLFLFVTCSSLWLMERSKNALKAGLIFLLAFIVIRSYSFFLAGRQRKIIVYNVPQKRAVDLVNGRSYFFVGDSGLVANDFVRNFHLKPARIMLRLERKDQLPGLFIQKDHMIFFGKKILLLDKPFITDRPDIKPVIDLLVISKNPKIYIKKLSAMMEIKLVVFDASVPAWKANYWKRDCDSLNIPWHDVSEDGAFVMSLR